MPGKLKPILGTYAGEGVGEVLIAEVFEVDLGQVRVRGDGIVLGLRPRVVHVGVGGNDVAPAGAAASRPRPPRRSCGRRSPISRQRTLQRGRERPPLRRGPRELLGLLRPVCNRHTAS